MLRYLRILYIEWKIARVKRRLELLQAEARRRNLLAMMGGKPPPYTPEET